MEDQRTIVGNVRTQVIDITPHYGAMTKAGNANFNRFSDASAEFIDNSLQAYKSVNIITARNISLRLYLNEGYSDQDQRASYMVISDGGIGMSTKDLHEFATYSLDKKTRQLQEQEFIGKFGVGAKQSGFFLGDRIHVITRKESGPILELILDENEFESRRTSGMKVFETEIKERSLTSTVDRTMYTPSDELEEADMQTHIASCEQGNVGPDGYNKEMCNHFTIIIIRLKRQRVQELRSGGRYREVPYELAQIYHFYLHPQHLPQNIVGLESFRQSKSLRNEQILNEMAGRLKDYSSERGADRNIKDEGPLNIYFSVVELDYEIVPVVNIRDLEDDEVSLYVKKAKAVFRFNMAFPLPDQSMVGEANFSNKTDTQKRTTAQGIIFYYPYEGDRESRPMVSPRKIASRIPDEGMQIKLGGSKSQSSSSSDNRKSAITKSQECISGNEDETELIEEPNTYDPDRLSYREQAMCDIYWVNRFVPQSFLSKLPLFPKTLNTPAECEAAGVPKTWRNRLKAFIFFDYSWESISNNKLKIQVDPDIDTYINIRCEGKGSITFSPKEATSKFKTWLKACHDEFDRETHFKNRLGPLEDTCRAFKKRDSMINCKDKELYDSALFNTLEIGGMQNRKTFNVGDNVKLFLTAKNKLSSKSFIYAKIIAFDVPCKDATRSATEHFGRGNVRYLRLPVAIYHPHKQVDAEDTVLTPVKDTNGENMVLPGAGMAPHLGAKHSKLAIQLDHIFANEPISVNAIHPNEKAPTDREIMVRNSVL